MTDSNNTKVYQEMTVLIVDDDRTVLDSFKLILKDFFNHVLISENTKEDLGALMQQGLDLIIIGSHMPIIDKFELVQAIRKLNKTIPLILSISKQDENRYDAFLDLNITHSIRTPITKLTLETLLEKLLSPVAFYKACEHLNKAKIDAKQEQEKEGYNQQQHKQAFLKEHQAIKNDFYYQYYQHPSDDSIWYLDGSYRPHDILSGDTYSIRKLNENRAFFFIIDAMGKGVSASVTSIVASSYINHLIDIHHQDFDFKTFLHRFNEYILKSLLQEEVLAVLFAEIDFTKQSLTISSYGMPPILMCDVNNELIKIKTNNLPISKHNSVFNIDHHSLEMIEKILFCSDGLVESTLENGDLYFSYLKEDFKNSKTRSSFLKKLYSKVSHPDDDITLLFLQKRHPCTENLVTLSCTSKLNEVEKLITHFHNYLEANKIDPIHTAKLSMIFSEMIMNAYEHGNLNISNQEKRKLIMEGTFKNECTKRESQYGSKEIKVRYRIHTQGEGKCLKFDILDEGEGFNTEIFKKLIFDQTSVNGRGFKIAKKMVDAIYYSTKGNHVILHKYIPRDIS